jgi:hypothetical protein
MLLGLPRGKLAAQSECSTLLAAGGHEVRPDAEIDQERRCVQVHGMYRCMDGTNTWATG